MIKPDDLLLILKLAVSDGIASVRALESELGISKSAIAQSLKRLESYGLLRGEGPDRRVDRLAVRDLVAHGLRWIAPAKPGNFELGLLTAHSASPLVERLRGDADPVVIPLAHGPARGRAVVPLHPGAAHAAQRDPKLYKLLVVADAFRIGSARDREVATAELNVCL